MTMRTIKNSITSVHTVKKQQRHQQQQQQSATLYTKRQDKERCTNTLRDIERGIDRKKERFKMEFREEKKT